MKIIQQKRENSFLGEILIRCGAIGRDDLDHVLELQRKEEKRSLTGQLLVRTGRATEHHIVSGLARQYGFPFLPVNDYLVSFNPASILPQETALKHLTVPLEKFGASLLVAMANPLDQDAIHALETMTGCSLKICIGLPSEIRKKIETIYTLPAAQPAIDFPEERFPQYGRKKGFPDRTLKREHSQFVDEAERLLKAGFYFSCLEVSRSLAEKVLAELFIYSLLGEKSPGALPPGNTATGSFAPNLMCQVLEECNIISHRAVASYRFFEKVRTRALHSYPSVTEADARAALSNLAVLFEEKDMFLRKED